VSKAGRELTPTGSPCVADSEVNPARATNPLGARALDLGKTIFSGLPLSTHLPVE